MQVFLTASDHYYPRSQPWLTRLKRAGDHNEQKKNVMSWSRQHVAQQRKYVIKDRSQ